MAQGSRPAKRSSLNPLYVILGVVGLAAVGVLAYRTMGKEDPAREPVQLSLDRTELTRVQGISVGREDAPVVLYEFADFQCPGCGQFAIFMAPLIKERLVEPGLVRYVYYDFPLVSIHPHAFLAARAGRCANDQGGFWAYHDFLYGRQPQWSAMRNPTDYFVDLAGEAGLNRGEFESCLRSDRFAEEVTRSMKLGESLRVQGTPTLVMNGKVLPSVPNFQELERMVREEAGAAAPAPAAATDTATADASGSTEGR